MTGGVSEGVHIPSRKSNTGSIPVSGTSKRRVREWLKRPTWKVGSRVKSARGFEFHLFCFINVYVAE